MLACMNPKSIREHKFIPQCPDHANRDGATSRRVLLVDPYAKIALITNTSLVPNRGVLADSLTVSPSRQVSILANRWTVYPK